MWRRPNTLYLFVTSPRPNPYVNVVVHAVRTYPLTHIYFVGIKGHEYDSEPTTTDAGLILADTRRALESLAGGEYRSGTYTAALSASEAQVYKDCLDRLPVHIAAISIEWRDLDVRLREFDKRSLFDVTALRKNLLVDVVTLLLSQGDSAVWSFELIKTPLTYHEKHLVHALTAGTDFKYLPMTESPHVETARKRMIARSRTFRTLVLATLLVAIPVTVSQLFFSRSWIQSVINVVATTVGIASWAFAWIERRR